MKCEIISVGTELLLGDILNTNSQYLSKELANIGLDIYYQNVVGDNKERMIEIFKLALERSDLIITTGGLGPTDDDMTKEIACEVLGLEMSLHKESLKSIKDFFDKIGREFIKSNEKQAYFPENSIILKNNNGTAPGAILEKDNKKIIILPGPPSEMKIMFKESVKPYIEKLTGKVIVSDIVKVFGLGESSAEQKLKDLIDNGKNPTIAPYAKEGEMLFRITAKANSIKEAKELNNPLLEEIKKRIGEYIYNIGEEGLNEIVSKKLIEENITISCAESCTGGMLSSTFIECSGISKIFLEGAVTYSNEAKIRTLNVNKGTLEKYGAVSKETAIEMAEGIRILTGSKIGISTTGVAGPDGGTTEKPVGLVYICISMKDKNIVSKNIFPGNRNSVRKRTCLKVFDMIRREIF